MVLNFFANPNRFSRISAKVVPWFGGGTIILLIIGIYFSLFFHLSILLFAIGLPDFFKPNKIPMPQIIPIEILNISDVSFPLIEQTLNPNDFNLLEFKKYGLYPKFLSACP